MQWAKKFFFSQMISSTLPLPACKNLALYDALTGRAWRLNKLTKRASFTMKFTGYVRGNFPRIPIIINGMLDG